MFSIIVLLCMYYVRQCDNDIGIVQIRVHNHRRTKDFTMEGVLVVGAGPGSLGTEPPPQ